MVYNHIMRGIQPLTSQGNELFYSETLGAN